MTTCCLETNCTRCCIETNMVLTTNDIQTIEKLGHEARSFVSERNGWLRLKNKKGRCVFHNGTVCTIYDHRPEGCVLYPVVYDKDHRMAILDSDCPQRHCFLLSDAKSEQLYRLISKLEKERAGRKKKERGKIS
jgi:Fe-S-cluster containining protein